MNKRQIKKINGRKLYLENNGKLELITIMKWSMVKSLEKLKKRGEL